MEYLVALLVFLGVLYFLPSFKKTRLPEGPKDVALPETLVEVKQETKAEPAVVKKAAAKKAPVKAPAKKAPVKAPVKAPAKKAPAKKSSKSASLKNTNV